MGVVIRECSMAWLFVLALMVGSSFGAVSSCVEYSKMRDVIRSVGDQCYIIHVSPATNLSRFSATSSLCTVTVNGTTINSPDTLEGYLFVVQVSCSDPNGTTIFSYSGVYDESVYGYLNGSFPHRNLTFPFSPLAKYHPETRVFSDYVNSTIVIYDPLTDSFLEEHNVTDVAALAAYYNGVSGWTFVFVVDAGAGATATAYNRITASESSWDIPNVPPYKVVVQNEFLFFVSSGDTVTTFSYSGGQYNHDPLSYDPPVTPYLGYAMLVYAAPTSFDLCYLQKCVENTLPPGKITIFPAVDNMADFQEILPAVYPIHNQFGQLVEICSSNAVVVSAQRSRFTNSSSYQGVVYVYTNTHNYWKKAQLLEFPDLAQGIEPIVTNLYCEDGNLVVSFSNHHFFFTFENNNYVRRFSTLDSRKEIVSFADYCLVCKSITCQCSSFCFDDIYFTQCQSLNCKRNEISTVSDCHCYPPFLQVSGYCIEGDYFYFDSMGPYNPIYPLSFATVTCASGYIGPTQTTISYEDPISGENRTVNSNILDFSNTARSPDIISPFHRLPDSGVFYHDFPTPICAQFWNLYPVPREADISFLKKPDSVPIFQAKQFIGYEDFRGNTSFIDFGYMIKGMNNIMVVAMKEPVGTSTQTKLVVLEYTGTWNITAQIEPTVVFNCYGYDVYEVREVTFIDIHPSGDKIMIGFSSTVSLFSAPSSNYECDNGLVYIYQRSTNGGWIESTVILPPLQSAGCSTFGLDGLFVDSNLYILSCDLMLIYDSHYFLANQILLPGGTTSLSKNSKYAFFFTDTYLYGYAIRSLSPLIGFSNLEYLFFSHHCSEWFCFIYTDAFILEIRELDSTDLVQELVLYSRIPAIISKGNDLFVSDYHSQIRYYVYENSHFVLKTTIQITSPTPIPPSSFALDITDNTLIVGVPAIGKVYLVDYNCLKYGGCKDFCDGTMQSFQCVTNNCSGVGGCDNTTETCKFNGTSYACECASGYMRNASGQCDNINECSRSIRPSKCFPNQICMDTPGSFECICPSGFVPSLIVPSIPPTPCVQDFVPINVDLPGSRTLQILSSLIYGDWMFVGFDNAEVHVWKLVDNKWYSKPTITPPVQSSRSYFGWSISMNDNYVAISDPQSSVVGEAGYVALYKLSNDRWQLLRTIPSIFDSSRINFYTDYLESLTSVFMGNGCPIKYYNSTYAEYLSTTYSFFGDNVKLNAQNELVITSYDEVNPGWVEVWNIQSNNSSLSNYFIGSVYTSSNIMSFPCNTHTRFALSINGFLFASTTPQTTKTYTTPNFWTIVQPNSEHFIPYTSLFIDSEFIANSIDYFSGYVIIGSNASNSAILLQFQPTSSSWIVESKFTPLSQYPVGSFGTSVCFDPTTGHLFISDPDNNIIYYYTNNNQGTNYQLQTLIKGENAVGGHYTNFGKEISIYDGKLLVATGTDIFLVFLNCKPGYTKLNCLVIDECALGTHQCEQECTFLNDTTVCGCYTGFTVDPQDSNYCDDIDECTNNTHNCEQVCSNTPGSYNCSCSTLSTLNPNGYSCDCIPGYKKDGGICEDINECLDLLDNCTQENQICANTVGSFFCSCDRGCEEVNGQCLALPCGISKSSWKECPSNICHVPSLYRTFNISYSTPECPVAKFESLAYYPVNDANLALSKLQSEFLFGGFLENQLKLEGLVFNSLRASSDDPPGLTITYTPKVTLKRSLNSSSCPSISHILLESSNVILPMVEPTRFIVLNGSINNDSACEAMIQIQPLPENRVVSQVGVTVGSSLGSILFVVLIILAIVIYKYFQSYYDYSILPPEVRKFYEMGRDNLSQWKKYDGEPEHYSLEITEDSDHGKDIQDIFAFLQGIEIPIKSMMAVYNPSLVQGFCSYKSVMRSRRQNSPAIFNRNEWKKASNVGLREFIVSEYQKLLTKYSWNEENELAPVIPVIHGTTMELALKICQNGFAATSLLDSGYYGKGIYFTSSALYATPYFASKKEPAIMICWLLPGNIYPVTEHPTEVPEDSLVGKALFPGYQSHYVLTNVKGFPIKSTKPKTTIYDEIVIEQEQQVVPGFIITPRKDCLASLLQQFNREVVDVERNTSVGTKKSKSLNKSKQNETQPTEEQELQEVLTD